MTVGTLNVVGSPNNRKIQIGFINSKGQFVQKNLFEKNAFQITEEQISIGLVEKAKADLNTLKNVKVEFDEEGDQLKKIREQGQPWDRGSATISKTATGNTTNRPGKVNPNNFHNPYNFIPALPRDKVTGDLGDSKPVGHGMYHSDRYSGRISVKLTTVTPLLIPDASLEEEDNRNNHKTYPVRLGADGQPYLPPTSIKGMLRSAYEAVTNSRLSVFEKHDARLAYRMPATKGTVAKPARVEKRKDGLYLRILEDSSCVGGAAKLHRYDKNGKAPDKGEQSAALKYATTRQLPKHGDKVRVQLSRGKVIKIDKWDSNDYPGGEWKLGWVCVTGANIGGKQNERVFIQSSSNDSIKITKNIKELWENLIADYQATHIKDLENRKRQNKSPSDYLGRDPGKTAWSRHVYDKDQLKLREGILCYVELDGDDVIALQPVTISRRLYDQKPSDLLPDSLHPATNKEQLSPADRVFGWVNQQGNGSYKGHLRVHSVICKDQNAVETFNSPGVPLAILGEPKPAQTRFYTAENKQGQPLKVGKNKEYGYQDTERGLRGRKVYPHHNHLPDEYWHNPTEDRTQDAINGYYQEYRRPSSSDERDSQNRSITGWVKPNVEFNFEIDVTNLSTVELGGLLWLLSLPDGHFHRLGGAKPLGFGSVRLEIDLQNTELKTGQEWKSFYSSLEVVDCQSVNVQSLVANYQKTTEREYGKGKPFEKISFIVAFCRCAQGYNDNVAIHYPRTTVKPLAQGEAFEWFVNNEKAGGQHQGKRLSLPSLEQPASLPINPTH